MTSKVKWMFAKPSPLAGVVEDFEEEFGCKFPSGYKSITRVCNGGSPIPSFYPYARRSGIIFNNLLSWPYEADGEGSHRVRDALRSLSGRLPKNVIPFASDPAGNYLCFDFNKTAVDSEPLVVFWVMDREDPDGLDPRQAVIPVCDSFSELVRSLTD